MIIFFRSNHRRCPLRKAVLRNLAKFTGKHLCQSIIFNKDADLRHQKRHSIFILKLEWKRQFFCISILKIEKRQFLIRAPKVPFNFKIKIGMKKSIFAHFNFNSKLKIEKRHFFFNFQFSIFI